MDGLEHLLDNGVMRPLLPLALLACPALGQIRLGPIAPAPVHEVLVHVDATRALRKVPPGAVGWGAMWKRGMLWPAPPKTFTDASHAGYIKALAAAQLPLVRAADMRHVSWPWGVTFSTWGVNWENSAGPWSKRVPDCARILGRGSGWCEKTIVGVGDLMTLAAAWKLEAITVSVPLAVIDGTRVRWGPGLLDHAFTKATIEKVSDHARRLIAFMKSRPEWSRIPRIYLAAGCEWRHYTARVPSAAVLTYAALVKRIRERITDTKVIVVACASDSADLGGLHAWQAASWNRYVYEALVGIPGIAMDLHRYRGMVGLQPDANGATPMTPHNIDALVKTGVTQRGFLSVHPGQWAKSGPAMPSVLLENAIHGLIADHSTTGTEFPWPAVLAHADLVREALAGPALAFLGWTWFPEALPREWPHGAQRDGELAPHARAQAFLSAYHRGEVVASSTTFDAAVRVNATREPGVVRVYGGNFSRTPVEVHVATRGAPPNKVTIETMDAAGRRVRPWDGHGALSLGALTLFRIAYR